MSKVIKDKVCLGRDTISHTPTDSNHGLWAKTQVLCGYGLHKNEFGISDLDEVVFDTCNMVPIGGVQYAMEMIFGIKGKHQFPTLDKPGNDGIGSYNESLRSGTDGMPYYYGQRVCLFGVGYGGAAENNITVKEVKYTEAFIDNMVPFRYTNEPLKYENNNLFGKYYGRRDVQGTTGYYLKTFNEDPKIYHRYKNGINSEDGDEIDTDLEYDQSVSVGIETYTEILFTISQDDVREWFDSMQIEPPRINSIGLFTAVFDNSIGADDYTNIKLFSKFNMPTEVLLNQKSMDIIYRVYGS